MLDNRPEELTPAVQAALEARLDAWGARRTLTPDRAESIRRAILSQAAPDEPSVDVPDTLTYAWWARFTRELCAGLQSALDIRPIIEAQSL